jgi:AraC family transcriptional regulator
MPPPIQPARLAAFVQSDPAGLIESPGPRNPVIVIHVGTSVHVACSRGDRRHQGVAVHGDIDIIPANVPSRWELKARDTALIVSVPNEFIAAAAEDARLDPRHVEIVNRFQTRDRQIENIGWALMANIDSGSRSGPLYVESLGMALAACLLDRHSSVSTPGESRNRGLSGLRLRQVISYVEENLGNDLSLSEIAAVAGLGSSHFKVAFREATGLPVHKYVIRRRVERARSLLAGSPLPISQIALETGFAHQSHLAWHMRRLLGVSPLEFRKTDR